MTCDCIYCRGNVPDTIRTERRSTPSYSKVNENGEMHVQCLAGHVFNVPRGSDLEKRAIDRAKHGYLDALCVRAKECPECGEYDSRWSTSSMGILQKSEDDQADEAYMLRCIENDLFHDQLEKAYQEDAFAYDVGTYLGLATKQGPEFIQEVRDLVEEAHQMDGFYISGYDLAEEQLEDIS